MRLTVFCFGMDWRGRKGLLVHGDDFIARHAEECSVRPQEAPGVCRAGECRVDLIFESFQVVLADTRYPRSLFKPDSPRLAGPAKQSTD